MFGYVIPYKAKLTDEQWKSYRAAYCGLCHTLSRQYGFLASFLLNYDFTFLAFLLREENAHPCISCRRCISAPIRGRNSCASDDAMHSAADGTMLLTYWKLKDQLSDEKGLKKLSAAALLVLYHRPFRKARIRNPGLNQSIAEHITSLSELEKTGCSSIDRTSDQFALILQALAPQEIQESRRRALQQLLYHLGRWIYLIDAWDDLKEDLSCGQYNPIVQRFGLSAEDLSSDAGEQAKQIMERTIMHSEHLAVSAFHLIDFGEGTPIVENILCAGLPSVRCLVFSGQWKTARNYKKQELNRI